MEAQNKSFSAEIKLLNTQAITHGKRYMHLEEINAQMKMKNKELNDQLDKLSEKVI